MAETATEAPRLYRGRGDRLLAGVGSGLARHLGIDPVVTRLALLALAIGGIGIAVYLVLAFFVPVRPETEDDGVGDGGDARRKGRDISQLLAYLALAAGLGVLFLLFGGVFDPLLWFLVFGTLGAAILWQQANPAQRDQWVSSTAFRSRKSWVRTGAGVLLVVTGVLGFLAFQQQMHEARAGLTFALTMLAGIALIAAPWIIGLVRERDRERRERIRNQERAELAAHIHDSVLHTLTLIQRRAEDSREVQRLARVQERALRSWLYKRPADAETTVTPALERVAAEVEEAHGVPIEVVCVGDCPIDDGIRAALQAAREAMVNASKYADVDSVSVFGEVEPEEVLVFIRDRGAGFDLDSVPADRMGVRGSIIGRMQRHGGGARIRTAPGEGTEVQLRMPRSTAV
ncbi:signal transduction histidine kinase/phage shock protein PspC (stress-responsive transcriptional regulator) [Spinactinospora alkalitolerans]|uniref:Signal transduction histidine kinase/phage shock protein PspC (Stress-responsive transcriptional regulator) n=1 Tax=Spinactinospora alkalitolerans TaxID=687207 RepID=A0A852U0K4_9ACTN|nr:ATP-binding protein [Spinactinospora alkalitolerans]NYE49769.1 signal transduction histidine kinase/phage shock protein PspC (stress-responsive transcriptional regulator) [Spinactinospora alkalitolerans]